MHPEIIKWIKDACKRYKMTALWQPETDVYLLLKNGRAVQGFNSDTFYQLPKRRRMNDIEGLIMRGLMLNSGEKYYQQLQMPRNGKKIV